MDTKQVKFRAKTDTIESQRGTLGGIALYNGFGELESVICGCCGGTFSPKEVEIVRKLEWIPISTAIIGE